MSGPVSLRERLLARLEAAGGDSGPAPLFPELSEVHFAQFERYFDLLRHWNRRINLTALPLDAFPDQTLDRLFVEPLCAARFLNGRICETGVGWTLSGPAEGEAPTPPLDRPDGETALAVSAPAPERVLRWADLGSGGGSPAIPLKIVCPFTHLTMVESRGRKAAFLRDVVRELKLPEVEVAGVRVEGLPATGAFDVVTVRAVRLDDTFLASIRRILTLNGQLILFLPNAEMTFGGFERVDALSVRSTSTRIAVLTASTI